jgi:hypothetical protein
MLLRALPLLLASALSLHAGPIFYAVSFGSGGVFGTIDPFTGNFTQIGSPLSGYVHDVAVAPNGAVYALIDANLVSIDKSTGIATTIGALPSASESLAFRPDGTLFDATYTDLYTVDPSTADSTLLGSMGLAVNADNIRFGGLGVLFVMSAENDSRLYTLNQTTGAATLVGASGVDDTSLGALYGGALYGTNQVGGTEDHIVRIDPATGLGTEGALTDNIYIFALDPTTVPEPSTLLLLPAGLVALFLWRRPMACSLPRSLLWLISRNRYL